MANKLRKFIIKKCEKCGKKIKCKGYWQRSKTGAKFWKFSHTKYCDNCKRKLKEENLKKINQLNKSPYKEVGIKRFEYL